MNISAYISREAIESGAAKAFDTLKSTWATTAGKVKIVAPLVIAGGAIYLTYQNRARILSMIGVGSSAPKKDDGAEKPDGTNDAKKPSETDETNDAEKPSETDETNDAEKPSETDETNDAEKPSETDETNDAEKPSETDETNDAEKPSETDETNDAKKPSETDETNDAEKPSGTDETNDAKKPDGARESENEHRSLPSTPPRAEEKRKDEPLEALFKAGGFGSPLTPTQNEDKEYTTTLEGYKEKSLEDITSALQSLGSNPNPGQQRALQELISSKTPNNAAE